MITIHKDSHLDHGLSQPQVAWILERFQDKNSFFIETVELPSNLGTVPCGLYGPVMGDQPVPEEEVVYQKRGTREWPSRMVYRPSRQVRTVTVIAGPYEGEPCVLYTAFGGPQAAQEPGDPKAKDKTASEAFWKDHALAVS